MSFTTKIAPYVQDELIQAKSFVHEGDPDRAFECLENAHVLGQRSTRWHTLVHFRMLQWAINRGDIREFFGQLFRIVGALTKTALGLVPVGNTGGANVSPFKPMPLSLRNAQILKSLK